MIGPNTGHTGRAGAIKDDVVILLELGQGFRYGVEVKRSGNVLGAVSPIIQSHNELHLISPVQFGFQFLAIYTSDCVHCYGLLILPPHGERFV